MSDRKLESHFSASPIPLTKHAACYDTYKYNTSTYHTDNSYKK